MPNFCVEIKTSIGVCDVAGTYKDDETGRDLEITSISYPVTVCSVRSRVELFPFINALQDSLKLDLWYELSRFVNEQIDKQ